LSKEPSDNTENLTVRERLAKESGAIKWSELVRHFARGVVIRVDAGMDLLDVATCFAEDDTDTLQLWLTENTVARASDDDARLWTETEPEFLCVVAAPWVLVQELGGGKSTPDTVH